MFCGRVEVRRQGEVLVDGLDAQALACARGVECRPADAVEEDLAGVEGEVARQRLHQRRFAGAVVADQGDDLARATSKSAPSSAVTRPNVLVRLRPRGWVNRSCLSFGLCGSGHEDLRVAAHRPVAGRRGNGEHVAAGHGRRAVSGVELAVPVEHDDGGEAGRDRGRASAGDGEVEPEERVGLGSAGRIAARPAVQADAAPVEAVDPWSPGGSRRASRRRSRARGGSRRARTWSPTTPGGSRSRSAPALPPRTPRRRSSAAGPAGTSTPSPGRPRRDGDGRASSHRPGRRDDEPARRDRRPRSTRGARRHRRRCRGRTTPRSCRRRSRAARAGSPLSGSSLASPRSPVIRRRALRARPGARRGGPARSRPPPRRSPPAPGTAAASRSGSRA